MQNSTHLFSNSWLTPAMANIYHGLQRQQLMRANPGGTVEVTLNLVFSDLTKVLSFSYIPALPSCFNCMNEGHLKWFGFKTKEGLWGMNPKQRDQLQCLFIPLLASFSLSFLHISQQHFFFSPLCWWCLINALGCDKELIFFFTIFFLLYSLFLTGL